VTELLTPAQVARLCACSEQHVRDLCREGLRDAGEGRHSLTFLPGQGKTDPWPRDEAR
jgi:hypothetical protein